MTEGEPARLHPDQYLPFHPGSVRSASLQIANIIEPWHCNAQRYIKATEE